MIEDKFKKIKASKQSIANRKLVCGVGINDADYMMNPEINGKRVRCPAYEKWGDMIKRCYSDKSQARHPTYIGCTVCKEWLTFSVFAEWFEVNNIESWELDKDIKVKGNKIYSPDTCLFIPQCMNTLLTDNAAKRGGCNQGVAFFKSARKYRAQISLDSKVYHLGYYDTEELASKAYKTAKNAEINRKCEQYPEFAGYLIKHLL